MVVVVGGRRVSMAILASPSGTVLGIFCAHYVVRPCFLGWWVVILKISTPFVRKRGVLAGSQTYGSIQRHLF